MSDSNPFAKLKDLFGQQSPSPDQNKAKGSSPLPSGGKPQRQPRAPSAKGQGDHDEDSALFLRTVNSLPKTSKTKRGAQEDSMFRHAMQAAGIVPMEQKNQKKRSKNSSSLAPQSTDKQGTPTELAPKHNADTPAPDTTGKNSTGSFVRGNDDALSQQTTTAKHRMGNARKSGRGNPGNSVSQQGFDVPQHNLDAHEAELFANAMSDVTPVNKRGRDIHAPAEAKKPPRPSGKTPAEIMQEIIDGRIEFAIQHTGEYMEGFVQGVSPEVLDKLRLGQFSPEAHIDLHGLNAMQAYTELTRFIKNAYQRNIRTVTVITGRGKNSPDGVAVLRNFIQEWLTHDPFKRVVLAFCSAQPRDGGAGAFYVLLRKYKKSIGKIQWELPYSGPDADF